MNITKQQVARALALPLGWRRRLASMEGPGWWADMLGDEPGTSAIRDGPTNTEFRLRRGQVYLPADRLCWLEAACAGGRWWERYGGHFTIMRPPSGAPDDMGDLLIMDSCPIDAALAYMESHEPPKEV